MSQYNLPSNTTGYSLIRFSVKKAADGNSFQRQDGLAEAFTRDENIILDRSLHEADIRKLGMTGFTGEHVIKGPLKKFFAGIDAGTVKRGSLLLVGEWSRLTRQIPIGEDAENPGALDLVMRLLRAGIGIVDLQDRSLYTLQRYNADVGLQLGLQLKISMSYQYSQNLRHNLKSVWQGRRRAMREGRAKASNACPEFFRVGEDGNYEIVPECVPVINRIIALRHEGLGKHSIATRLVGVPAFREGWHPPLLVKGWAASSVQGLVKNQALIGIYQPRFKDGTPDGDPQPDYYPRIISDDDFWRAQWPVANEKLMVLSDGKSVPTNGGRRTNGNLFGQVATKCAECGKKLHYVNKGVKKDGTSRGVFLQCGHSRYAGRCSNKTPHKYGILEAETLAMLGKLDFSRLLESRREPATDRIAALTAEIAETNATLARLLSLFSAKTPEPVAKRIAELSEQVEAKEAELGTLRRDARIIEAEASRDAFLEFQTLLAALETGGDAAEAIRDRIAHELGRIVAEMVGDGNVLRVRLHGAGSQHMELQFVDSRFVRVLIVNDAPVSGLVAIGMDSVTSGKRVAPGGLARYVAS